MFHWSVILTVLTWVAVSSSDDEYRNSLGTVFFGNRLLTGCIDRSLRADLTIIGGALVKKVAAVVKV